MPSAQSLRWLGRCSIFSVMQIVQQGVTCFVLLMSSLERMGSQTGEYRWYPPCRRLVAETSTVSRHFGCSAVPEPWCFKDCASRSALEIGNRHGGSDSRPRAGMFSSSSSSSSFGGRLSRWLALVRNVGIPVSSEKIQWPHNRSKLRVSKREQLTMGIVAEPDVRVRNVGQSISSIAATQKRGK